MTHHHRRRAPLLPLSLVLAVALVWVSGVACSRSEPAPQQPGPATPPTAAAPQAAPSVDPSGRPKLPGDELPPGASPALRRAQTEAGRVAGDGGPAAVYGKDAPAHPVAAQVCKAMHSLPAARRAACCGATSLGVQLGGACENMLGAALGSGALTIDAKAAGICARHQHAALEGCDWVGPNRSELPEACADLTQGTLPGGEACRSSLECMDGLHCRGVSPTQRGVCAPPAPRGRACQTGVDTLAAFTGQAAGLLRHPECEGRCVQGRCEDITALGAACSTNVECGRAAHCDGKVCVAGATAAPGGACTGGACVRGSRCVDGTCQAPRATGEACTQDAQCRGACLLPEGAAEESPAGVCGKRCQQPLRGLRLPAPRPRTR